MSIVLTIVSCSRDDHDSRINQAADSPTDGIVFVRVDRGHAHAHVDHANVVGAADCQHDVKRVENCRNRAVPVGIQHTEIDQIRGRRCSAIQVCAVDVLSGSERCYVRSMAVRILSGSFTSEILAINDATINAVVLLRNSRIEDGYTNAASI